MSALIPFLVKRYGLILIALLLPLTLLQARPVSDTLTLERVVNDAIEQLLLQDEQNTQNERIGQAHLNQYTLTINLTEWLEEKGKGKKMLSKDQFSQLSQKLRKFNQRPDKLRMYVLLVNDYEVKFTTKLAADLLTDSFKWSDLAQYPQQQKTVKGIWSKTATIVKGVAAALKSAGFDERVVYFYSQLRVEDYGEKSHFYHYDRLNFYGDGLVAQEKPIKQHIKISNTGAVDRIDLAVSSLINSIEAIRDQGYTTNDNLVASIRNPSHALPENDFTKIPTEDFTRFAKLVDVAFAKEDQKVSWEQTKGEADYKRINVPKALEKSSKDQLRDFEIEVLEDKLRYLQKVTDIEFYVTVAPFWYDLSAEQSNQFAQEVFKRTTNLSKQKKVVLITIPFYNQEYVNMAALASDPFQTGSVMQPGIYAQGVDIDLAMVKTSVGGAYEFVFNAYKHLAKPYSNVVYGLQVDGTVKSFQGQENGLVKGYEAIDELVLLRDKQLDMLAEAYSVRTPPDLKDPAYQKLVSYNASVKQFDTQKYQADLAIYQQYLVALQKAINTPLWEVDEDGKRLKEPFVKTHHANFIKEFIGKDASFLSKLGSNVNWSVLVKEKSLTGKQYDFRLASRYVKPLTDKLWLVPLLPNAICLIWAQNEGDYVLVDQQASALTVEIAINLTAYGAGKTVSAGFQVFKGMKAYTQLATKWSLLAGREVSEAVMARAIQRYSLNAAEKAVLANYSDEVLSSLSAEGNKKLLAKYTKEEFLRYVALLAEATGASDAYLLGKLATKLTASGIDAFYAFTSRKLLPVLSRKDLLYEGVLSTLFIRLPAYSVHSLAFLLKSGKDFPSASYDLFRQWMQKTGKGSVLKAEQELLQKQAFEQLQADLLALQELKNAKGEAITLGDELLIDLLERFPYPGQLQTLLKKAGSAEKLSQLLDNLTPFAANKSQLYSIITKIPNGKVDDFLADVGKSSQFAKAIAENPTLMEAWGAASDAQVADVLRRDTKFLKEYDILRKNEELKKHVFDGEIKKNSVKGGHFSDAFDGNNFRLGDGTTDLSRIPQNSKGVRKIDESIGVQKKKILKDAQGNITGERWLDKNIDPLGGHTLFPEGWDIAKITEEVSSAFANPIKSNWASKSNAFKATSKSGVEIGWFVDPTGNITTFFPIF